VLEIPVSFIHIIETSNSTVPNASPSASSLCTDLYGMAVVVSDSFAAVYITAFSDACSQKYSLSVCLTDAASN